MTSKPVYADDCEGKRVRWVTEDGRLHRTDGSAVEWESGKKAWWVNGRSHRIDGPAIEWENGTTKVWRINGNELDDSQLCDHLKQMIIILMTEMITMEDVNDKADQRVGHLVSECAKLGVCNYERLMEGRTALFGNVARARRAK